MTKSLTLTDDQMATVKAACGSLRPSSHDRFLQDLACELARYRHPPSDAELHLAIRSLLRIVPVNHFVSLEPD